MMSKTYLMDRYSFEFKIHNLKFKIIAKIRYNIPLQGLGVLLLLSFNTLIAQTKYPKDVEVVLQKTKTNRVELEKALNYFYKSKDSLKIKAINFLVANMDIHTSYNYYWADSLGKRLSFNELDYPSFDSSIHAFEALKANTPKIHPVPYNYRDIDSIKGDYLIENEEMAFADWQQPLAKGLSFDDFCEYLLPYRISVEPLQNWRAYYKQYFKNLSDSINGKSLADAISAMTFDCHNWFANTYNREQRTDPLPRLDALQLLNRKKGACEDFTGLGVLEARALGMAATEEIVPYWATSSASHFFDVAITSPKNIPYEQLSGTPVNQFVMPREPGKVLRLTYSRQPVTLANTVAKEAIPLGFMRSVNYKDVTSEYWETQDVGVWLTKSKTVLPPNTKRLVYACVFNTLDWRPEWWAKTATDTATFTAMSKGVVYLPMYYQNDKLIPAAYPIAVGYHHTQVLQPDTANTHTIHLKEQDKYLRYQPAKKYTLYYWNNRWKPLATQMASFTEKELIFDGVPKNALLLMVPEYTQHKERPFMITEEGERIWW